MDVAEHLRIIWRWKLWIGLASLLIAAAVYALQAQKPDVYVTYSQLRVSTGQEAEGKPVDKSGTIFLAQQYAELLNSASVLDRAVELVGTDIGRGKIRARSSASVSTSIGRITVRVTGPSVAEARAVNVAVSNALVEAVAAEQQRLLDNALAPLRAEILELERQVAAFDRDDTENRSFLEDQIRDRKQDISNRQAQAPNEVTILNEAIGPPNPIAPTPQRDAIVALIVALLINAELAVAFTIYGDRLSDDDDIARVLAGHGVRVLGRIPDGPYDANSIESFRDLRTSLLFLRSPDEQLRVAVVGAARGIGKSYVALRTAESIASTAQRTVLIDTDLRAPSIHTRLGIPLAPGVTDAVESGGSPMVTQVNDSLIVLTAGTAVTDPAGLLGSSRFDDVLAEVVDNDVLVFDTPPVLLFGDALAVSTRCTGALLVIDAQVTRRSDIEQSLARLEQVGVRVLGAVLNRASVPDRRYYAA